MGTKKKCFKCGKVKNIDDFYHHEKMGDKHLGKCKTCTKKDVMERYYNPFSRKKILEYERQRFKNPERKLKLKIYQRVRRRNSIGKNKTLARTYCAIKNGRLIKKPCEVCGNLKVQAHHDYRSYMKVKRS